MSRLERPGVDVWVESADVPVRRGGGRVQRGGHDVPEGAIRRRHAAGLHNFFELYRPLATAWEVYDNSRREIRLVAFGTGTEVVGVGDGSTWRRIEEEGRGPAWREAILRDLDGKPGGTAPGTRRT